MSVEVSEDRLNSLKDDTLKPWYVDSGATNHVITSTEYFNTLAPRLNLTLRAPNGSNLGASGIGQAEVKFLDTRLIMPDVTHSPSLNGNYLSLSRLVRNGYEVRFFSENGEPVGEATVNNRLIFKAKEQDGLFQIEFSDEQINAMTTLKSNTDELLNWHRRLGHLNFQSIIRLKDELGLRSTSPIPSCNECELAKSNRLPFNTAEKKTTRPLELIHTDTSGHIRIPNTSNYTSFVTFTDDFSRYSCTCSKERNNFLTRSKCCHIT